MLRPSTAPRWKTAIKVLRRPFGATVSPCACARAARCKNDGALPTRPTLASASPLCFMNNLLFITLDLVHCQSQPPATADGSDLHTQRSFKKLRLLARKQGRLGLLLRRRVAR